MVTSFEDWQKAGYPFLEYAFAAVLEGLPGCVDLELSPPDGSEKTEEFVRMDLRALF